MSWLFKKEITSLEEDFRIIGLDKEKVFKIADLVDGEIKDEKNSKSLKEELKAPVFKTIQKKIKS